MKPTLASKQPLTERGTVVFNRPVARDTFRMRIAASAIAERIRPGQFVMVRLSGRNDPLLARPYALYDTADLDAGSPRAIDIVYLVLGNGTRSLSRCEPGQALDLWGPLGNTFPWDSLAPGGHVWLIAGGIGQTPFLAVLRQLLGERVYGHSQTAVRPERVSFLWGLRSADYLALLDDFRRPNVSIGLASNDGSVGHRGHITDLAKQWLAKDPPNAILACGPEPMLRALWSLIEGAGIACWVSLETRMACGYGVCFSCVSPVRETDGWDYRRICIEGPIFPIDQIAWDRAAPSP